MGKHHEVKIHVSNGRVAEAVKRQGIHGYPKGDHPEAVIDRACLDQVDVGKQYPTGFYKLEQRRTPETICMARFFDGCYTLYGLDGRTFGRSGAITELFDTYRVVRELSVGEMLAAGLADASGKIIDCDDLKAGPALAELKPPMHMMLTFPVGDGASRKDGLWAAISACLKEFEDVHESVQRVLLHAHANAMVANGSGES